MPSSAEKSLEVRARLLSHGLSAWSLRFVEGRSVCAHRPRRAVPSAPIGASAGSGTGLHDLPARPANRPFHRTLEKTRHIYFSRSCPAARKNHRAHEDIFARRDVYTERCGTASLLLGRSRGKPAYAGSILTDRSANRFFLSFAVDDILISFLPLGSSRTIYSGHYPSLQLQKDDAYIFFEQPLSQTCQRSYNSKAKTQALPHPGLATAFPVVPDPCLCATGDSCAGSTGR